MAPQKKPGFTGLLLNSFVESGRFSPRLLTVFLFVGLYVAGLVLGYLHGPYLLNGQIMNGYPPDNIMSELLIAIVTLLGVGKVANAWQQKQDTNVYAERAEIRPQPERCDDESGISPAAQAAYEAWNKKQEKPRVRLPNQE